MACDTCGRSRSAWASVQSDKCFRCRVTESFDTDIALTNTKIYDRADVQTGLRMEVAVPKNTVLHSAAKLVFFFLFRIK